MYYSKSIHNTEQSLHWLKTKRKLKYVEEAYIAFIKQHFSEEENDITAKNITMDKFRIRLKKLEIYFADCQPWKDEYGRSNSEALDKIQNKFEKFRSQL
jgi:hypothetical protein